jgi:two-component system, NtrC family, sensor kinase
MADILLVDDDELSLKLLEKMLLQSGHTVQCASNGAEGLSCVQTNRPDLIISDVLMPVMDGFELCRQLRSDPALEGLPIILYSSDYTDQQEHQLGISLGADRYVVKPSPPETLAAIITELLAEKRRSIPETENQALDEEMKLLRSYNEVLFNKLEAKMQELQQTIERYQSSEEAMQGMQAQIVQQEKMASIGQLAAGVAHEINNPMGFITSNLTSLAKYADRLDTYIAALQGSIYSCSGHPGLEELDQLRQQLKVDYIISDVRELVNESMDGANRVRRIVQDLKSFSRVDHAEQASTNLNESLETTINIAWNELKYIATLEREFGEIPSIPCYPQQLNQVFLNLLVNAAQAMETQGVITVRTWFENNHVCVSVKDAGKGMPEAVKKRVFEPFFTTKAAGKGTGLGLSISADIVRKHGGEISVESTEGVGTTFTVRLPVTHEQ